MASNAFVLLTSDYFPFSKTQCAVFKGTNRAVFLDKREYTGPLYQQIDEAVEFVLRNIRLGARIDGLIRKESFELPVEAIREMIINAHCHRNLTDESCVQVAIYDDRLEVTSPGGLYNGLTFEEAMQGHSKLRNRAIANIFSQMGLIEAWGTGLQRIKDVALEYGLSEPEFIEMPDMFRVNLFRNQMLAETQQKSEKNRKGNLSDNLSDKLSDREKRTLELIKENPEYTSVQIAEKMLVSRVSVTKYLKTLKEKQYIRRIGSDRKGYWEIL